MERSYFEYKTLDVGIIILFVLKYFFDKIRKILSNLIRYEKNSDCFICVGVGGL